jgi:hydroxymethylpyrimidine/phosphomethylpyrimidine kinase
MKNRSQTAMCARALTIAGSDSGGGAGIQADLKTFHSLGVYGMSVVTALTAQNTLGVHGILDVPPAFIELQLRSVLSDIGADAAKTGMLSRATAIRAVARTLKEFGVKRLVVDPVMVSKHGDLLLRKNAIKTLIEELLPLAFIVTPNISEAEILAGFRIRSIDDMKRAGRVIHAMGPRIVVIKGGHLSGEDATDVVFDGKRFEILRAKRLRARHTHGTGCTFSAAIAAYLALRHPPLDAIRKAKAYITRAIRRARPLGHGIAPVSHLPAVSIPRRGKRSH